MTDVDDAPAQPEPEYSEELPPVPTGEELLGHQSAFAHPTWALPMVLVMAVPFLLWGLLGHPVWLLIGSPFILVLFVWVYVRLVQRRRREDGAIDGGGQPGA